MTQLLISQYVKWAYSTDVTMYVFFYECMLYIQCSISAWYMFGLYFYLYMYSSIMTMRRDQCIGQLSQSTEFAHSCMH